MMRRDVSNLKVRRTGFKIVPSGEVFRRWFAFNSGRPGQAARPFAGFTVMFQVEAAVEVNAAVREQIVRALQRGRGGRGR